MKCNAVEPYPLSYCVTSVLASALKYYGIDIYSDLLGRFWEISIKYNKSGFLYNYYSKITVEPTIYSYPQLLEKYFNIKIRNLNINKESYIDSIKRNIENGDVIIASLDPFYFKHYENYYKYHGLNWNHYVLIYGYDDEKKEIYYMDTTRAFIEGFNHTMSYDKILESLFFKDNIYDVTPEAYILDASFFKNESSIHFYTNNSCECGYDAMRKLKEEIILYSKIPDLTFLKDQLDKLLYGFVLMSQHRDGNLRYIKNNFPGNKYIDKINNIMNIWTRMKFAIAPVRKKSLSQKYFDIIKYLDILIDEEKVIFNESHKYY